MSMRMLARNPSREAGPVSHPLEPGSEQRGQLGQVALGEVASDRLRCDQTSSTGFSSWAYGGSR